MEMTNDQVKAELSSQLSALNEAKDKLAAVDLAMARIEFKTDGTIVEANDAFLGAIGYRMDEIRGQHHRMFMFQDQLTDGSYDTHWSDVAAGRAISGDFRRRSKSGEEIWISASYTPVKDENGHTYKVIKFARDITDRVQAVDAMQRGLQLLAAGDLTKPVTEELSGDYDSLRQNFNSAQDQLRSAISNVLSTARVTDTGTTSLSARTQSQASSPEETAQVIRQMTRLVEITSNTSEAARSTEVISRVLEAMQSLSESFSEISKVTSVIDQISLQTNLLALDGGGEAGLGFAVIT